MMSYLFVDNAIAIAGLMLIVWAVSVAIKNASIIDLIWGLGFAIVACCSYITVEQPSGRKLLLAILTTVWGLRLSTYLTWRNVGKGEDYRYVEMRKRHGSKFWIVSLFTVFILQGLIMWIVSLPVQLGSFNAARSGVNPIDAIGIVIWTIGLFFETVGDFQLARFKSDPANKGHVMNKGLWRYTRHPNYFGDFMIWWGIYIVSIASGTGYWTIIGPILMSFFLMRVSGVKLLEKSLANTKEGFAEYQRRTSAFFPMPRKSDRSDM